MEDFCNGLLIITNSRAEKIQYNKHLFFLPQNCQHRQCSNSCVGKSKLVSYPVIMNFMYSNDSNANGGKWSAFMNTC